MSRTMLLMCVLTMAAGFAQATATVQVQPTGARHSLLPGLGVRGRFESRTWDLDLKDISPESAAISASLENMSFKSEVTAYGADLLVSIGSHVELRGILSVADIEIKGSTRAGRFGLDTGLGLLWGLGGRVTLPAPWPPGWNLEVDVEAVWGNYDDADLLYTGGGALASAKDSELDWRQFSISPTLSRSFTIITPYAGLCFATADADGKTRIGKTSEKLTFESEDLISLVVGARVDLGSLLHADVHVDLLTNEGVVVSILFRF
jgi:hypothetical protein